MAHSSNGGKKDDPVMKMYEAQAIVVEKEQELGQKDRELQQQRVELENARQEIERLRLVNEQQRFGQEIATTERKFEEQLAEMRRQFEETLTGVTTTLQDRITNLEDKIKIDKDNYRENMTIMKQSTEENKIEARRLLEKEREDRATTERNFQNQLAEVGQQLAEVGQQMAKEREDRAATERNFQNQLAEVGQQMAREREDAGCFSEMGDAAEAMRKLVDQSQEERKFFWNKEQKAADIEREINKLIELERKLEEVRQRLEQLKAMENEPQPDPSLPNQTCITCFEEENQALMFGCRAADGSPHDEVHYLCKSCCINYGESQLGYGFQAYGGIGLLCASFPACKGVLLWGLLKKIFPETLAKHLDKQFDTAALHGIEGIEYCKSCTFGNIIESKVMKYFICQNKDCMARFCRTCKTDYDKHIGKTCDEADPTRKDKRYALEEFLSATKFRVCSNCGTRYTKDDDGSPNKMTCTCKTTQCYICKEPNITYNHFGDGDKCRVFSNTHEDDKTNLEHAINEARNNDQWRDLLYLYLE